MMIWQWAMIAMFAAGALPAAASSAPAARDARDLLSQIAITPATPADITGRCATAANIASRLQAEIEERRGPATLRTDFAAYDALTNLVTSIGDEVYVVGSASPRPDLRTAAQLCINKMSTVSAKVALSQRLYHRLAAISRKGIGTADRYVLDRVLSQYRSAGVDRSPAVRMQLTQLLGNIAATGTEFERNISDDQREISFADPSALAGLPDDFIQSHKSAADGLIHIRVTGPEIAALLTYAQSPDTRKAAYLAALNIGWPANEAVLSRMISQRHELAQLLGYTNYAQLDLLPSMAKTPARAHSFLDDINDDARRSAQSDVAGLLIEAQKTVPGTTSIDAWSRVFYANMLRHHQFRVDDAELRQYFTLNGTRQGIFALMKKMFGADVVPWRTPVWAPDVTAWSLYDGKRLIGRFYLDLSPRTGKFNLGRAFLLRRGVKGEQVPIGGLLCNFPASGPMEHSQVVTFVHEFGHLIHFMYGGHQLFAAQSSYNVERDFLEAPSQMLEEWAWDINTLKTFARRPDGTQIGAEVVARMNAARRFGIGSEWTKHIGFSAVALGFYDRPPGFDLKMTYDALQAGYAVIPDGSGTHRYASFFHLNIYGASYYSYVWSKAIAYALFDRFRQRGLTDRATADAYRHAILEAGSTRPADATIAAFLGHAWSTAAFKRELAAGNGRY